MIVNIYSDGELRGTMDVSHIDGVTNQERFQNEWNGCLDGVKELFPDEWNVSDVESAMGSAGWIMRELEGVAVEY